jgi:hypothetical protein
MAADVFQRLLIAEAIHECFLARKACTFVSPQFRNCLRCNRGIVMKKQLVAALIAGSFFSFQARAQERAGSAALGAVSGAVVLGPVGAVAGALIGYTAGPSIAHSWGVGHSASRSRAQRAKQARLGAQEPSAKEGVTQGQGTQGRGTQGGTERSGMQEQAAAKINPPPPAKTPETPSGTNAAPPVQGFE